MTIPAEVLALTASTILRTARKAATESSRDPGLALVSIVFSAFAVEAFTNELLNSIRRNGPIPYSKGLNTLRELIDAARLEERHASLRTKVDVVAVALTGAKLDFGSPPFQDFGELMRLRDELAHSRPEYLATEPATTEDGTPTDHQTQINDRGTFLVARGLVKPPLKEVLTPLVSLIHSDRVAVWAHNAATATIRSLVAFLPSDGWRAKVSFALDLEDLPLPPMPTA